MKLITKPQIQKLYTLCEEYCIDIQVLVSLLTNGRTESVEELTKEEAISQICSMEDKKNKLINKILKQAYVVGIWHGETHTDGKLKLIAINNFLKVRGAVKKELLKMNESELKKTLRQLQAIANTKEKQKALKAAQDATDRLLKELNIPVMTAKQKRYEKEA